MHNASDRIIQRNLLFRALLCTVFFFLMKNGTIAQEKIRAIQIADSVPALNNEGQIGFYLSGIIKVYFCENLILYRLSFEQDSVVYRNGEFLSSLDGETKFYWFVQEKDSSYGYTFDEYRPSRNRWISRDSAVHGGGLIHFQFDISQGGPLRRLFSFTDPESGNVEEAYMDKDTVKNSRDTIYCTFSDKMKDIPFSFDNSIDSVKRMKLVELRLVTGKQYLPEYKITLPFRVTTVRMEVIPVDNQAEIKRYIHRFRSLGKRK